MSPPTKEGVSEDGWRSRIWVRGRRALRYRTKGFEGHLEEFEGKRIVRVVNGMELCEVMLLRWLSLHPEDREGSSQAGPRGTGRAVAR